MISYIFDYLFSANYHASSEEGFFPIRSEESDETLPQTPLVTPESETSDNQSPSFSQLALNSVWELSDSARDLVSYASHNPKEMSARLLLRCIQLGVVATLAEWRHPELATTLALVFANNKPQSASSSTSYSLADEIPESTSSDNQHTSSLQQALNCANKLISYATENRLQTILFLLYANIAAVVALGERGLIFPPEIPISALTGLNGFNISAPYSNIVAPSHFSPLLSNGLAAYLLAYPEGGEAYIVPLQTTPYPPAVFLEGMPNITRIIGNPAGGCTISEVGDINGDGRPDLLFAQPSHDTAYLIFSPPQWPSEIRLNDLNLNGIKGTMIKGIPKSLTGYSIAGNGDINGDGKPDFALLAPLNGFVYTIFGKNGEWPTFLNLTNLDGTNGFILNSITPQDLLDGSLAMVDINNDGLADLVTGAPTMGDGTPGYYDLGTVYVVFGKQERWPASMSFANLNGINGFTIINFEGQGGWSLDKAWNIRGDNTWSLLIGAPTANGDFGSVFCLFAAKSWPTVFSVNNLTGLNGLRFDDDTNTGIHVRGIGDIDGDGLGDFASSTYEYASREMASIVFGQKEWPSTFSLKSLNGKNGFRIKADDQNYGACTHNIAITYGEKGNAAIIIGTNNIQQGGYPTPVAAYVILTPEWKFYANTITIKPNETQTLSAENFNVTYRYCPDNAKLILTVKDVEHGRFVLKSSNQSIFSFPQEKIWNGELLFVSNGSSHRPSFVTTFQMPEYFNMIAYEAGMVNLLIPGASITPATKAPLSVIDALITAGCITAAVTLCLLSNAYHKHQTQKKLCALAEKDGQSINGETNPALLPIATAIFDEIKLTGFLNYISDESREKYFNVIKNLAAALAKQDGIDFGTMTDKEREEFVSIVAEQTKLAFAPKTRCSSHLRFFRMTPEVTSEKFESEIPKIAEAVVTARGELLTLNVRSNGYQTI
jgi:hypothetical protein